MLFFFLVRIWCLYRDSLTSYAIIFVTGILFFVIFFEKTDRLVCFFYTFAEQLRNYEFTKRKNIRKNIYFIS